MTVGVSLFERLKAQSAEEWRAYTEHAFVRRMGDGSLPMACFRHYLAQDYLFLIHFARAYALAAYKGESLADIRAGADGLRAILDEMGLHLSLCERWGLSPAKVEALPEARATMAYTRFVLDAGLAGDLLDLHVALAPCVVGYGEIGRALHGSVGERLADHPYREWIETYAGEDYQAVARAAESELDRLFAVRGGEGRMPSLIRLFRQATRLEADFWRMGLECAD